MSDQEKKATPPSIASIFGVFFGISAVTIGGGYVMVPVIQRAVEKRGWIAEAEFYDLFATAQSVPGPLALNTAVIIGRRLAGPAGFAAAALGIIVPPFAAILAAAAVFDLLGGNPVVRGFLDGAYAVVPGLTASLAFNMIRKRRWTPTRAIITAVGVALLILSGTWAVPTFFAVVAVAWLVERRTACSG